MRKPSEVYIDGRSLSDILSDHSVWLKTKGKKGCRADLSGEDLTNIDFTDADLSLGIFKGTDFRGSTFRDTKFRQADLSRATLSNLYIYDIDMSGVNFRGANLESSSFHRVNMKGSDFRDANCYRTGFGGSDLSNADFRKVFLQIVYVRHAKLDNADFRGAKFVVAKFEYSNLVKAKLSKKDGFRRGIVLKKGMFGWKKTLEGVVIKCYIPAGATVFCINGSKFRTNKARIVNTGWHSVLHSIHNPKFTYRAGQEIVIEDFDRRYNVECATGFHFFRTEAEAKQYVG